MNDYMNHFEVKNHFPSWINTDEKEREGQWAWKGEKGEGRSAPGETHRFNLVISPRWEPSDQRAPRANQHLFFSHKQVTPVAFIKLKFFVILEAMLLKDMEMPANTHLN